MLKWKEDTIKSKEIYKNMITEQISGFHMNTCLSEIKYSMTDEVKHITGMMIITDGKEMKTKH